jgi:RNA polymerase sigma-70 factor (ECF subfamily)
MASSSVQLSAPDRPDGFVQSVSYLTFGRHPLCKNQATIGLVQAFNHYEYAGSDSAVSKIINIRGRESDHERFERLIQPHFDALYRAASRLAMRPEDAEDLVQEVCVKAFVRLSDLETIEHRQAWLLRVLYNVFIDGIRRDKRSPHAETQTVDEVDLPGDPNLQPEVAAERMISLDMLWSAMNILNKEHCALLALHDIDGYTTSELASLSGLTESSIKSRIHRTRIKLGRLLKREVSGRPHLSLVGTQP